MYRALYRKWRPQTFADVVGQEAITAALQNQLREDKLGHAYLFTGTRGTGKTTCAKLLAKAANCENRNGAEPCGLCPMCAGMEDGSILDVQEIDAASNNGVEDVRGLREETLYRPARGRYRVFIIDEVHMLSPAAFNALLKTLEEPPEHVLFILATTEIHKVPATVRSRCQRFDFWRIPAEKIAERLCGVARSEGFDLTDGAAGLLARLGDGSMRDALSLLDTCAGLSTEIDEALVRRMAGVSDKENLFALSAAVAAGDTGALLERIAALHTQSVDMRRLCEELAAHYHNFLLAAAKPDGALLENMSPRERGRYTAAKVPEAFALGAVRRLADAMDQMSRSMDTRIELELALLALAEKRRGGDPAPAAGTFRADAVMPAEARPPAVPTPVPRPGDLRSAVSAAVAPRAGGGECEISATSPISSAIPAAAVPVLSFASTAPAPATPYAGWPVLEEAPAPPPAAGTVAASPQAAEEPLAPPVAAPATVAALESPEAADMPKPFLHWEAVLQRMRDVDRMLYTYMTQSAAYESGNFVLISGGELFRTFIRKSPEVNERIRTVIAEVTGRRYNLGPYNAPAVPEKPTPTAEDTLKEWASMGVEVKYE